MHNVQLSYVVIQMMNGDALPLCLSACQHRLTTIHFLLSFFLLFEWAHPNNLENSSDWLSAYHLLPIRQASFSA